MDRRDLGRCHQCGNLLAVHGHFVAEDCQHEEYYSLACGGIERRATRLRLDEPAWRKVYERRQKLIAQGPTSGSFLKRRRGDAQGTRRWIEEMFRLGQRLVADDAPDVPGRQPSSDLRMRRGPAQERRP